MVRLIPAASFTMTATIMSLCLNKLLAVNATEGYVLQNYIAENYNVWETKYNFVTGCCSLMKDTGTMSEIQCNLIAY